MACTERRAETVISSLGEARTSRAAAKIRSEFVLSLLEPGVLRFRQLPAGAIDVEGQCLSQAGSISSLDPWTSSGWYREAGSGHRVTVG